MSDKLLLPQRTPVNRRTRCLVRFYNEDKYHEVDALLLRDEPLEPQLATLLMFANVGIGDAVDRVEFVKWIPDDE